VHPGAKCCRSTPRCRSCPLVLARERERLLNLGPQGLVEPVPDHLAGVPACLHKYEPLLRKAWLERRQAAEAREQLAG
jgi:hypothetical protein